MIYFARVLLAGVGLASGLALCGAVLLVWFGIVVPLFEWLLEATCDRWRKSGASSNPTTHEQQPGTTLRVLVSDIHLDTWAYPGDPKIRAFLDFMAWVDSSDVIQELYINGDLMDVPPHPLNQPVVPILKVELGVPNRYPDAARFPGLGILNPEFDPILTTLSSMKKPVTYLTGNHDIGLYGLRFVRPDLTWNSVKVAWDPAVLLTVRPGARLYAEHGHLHDPFLWLYLRYAVMGLTQGPAAAQRRGKVGMGSHSSVRTLPSTPPPGPMYFEGAGDVAPPKSDGIAQFLARYRFRWAARRLFMRIRGDEGEPIQVVTMGHTHLPDRYVFPGGRLYINSGDWAGNDDHQCYVVIGPEGEVTGPHQWPPR